MVVYQYNGLSAMERELGLLLFCGDYWEKEIRKEIEDAVSEVCVREESVDDWIRKMLYELNGKKQSRNGGYSSRRRYCDYGDN